MMETKDVFLIWNIITALLALSASFEYFGFRSTAIKKISGGGGGGGGER